MVYIAVIDDPRALIFDGPVIYDEADKNILTSSNLEDAKDAWELRNIEEKEAELPCLRQNALKALKRIEAFTGKPEPGQRLLDFGSGCGYFLSVAKERGWEAHGLEPLPGASIYARAKFDLDIITDTLRDDTYPPEYFDVITSFQVFEHIPYPCDNLRQLTRALKRGGILLIEVPRYDTWSVKLLRSKHRHFVQDHLNFYSCESLSLLLENNGYEIVDHCSPPRIMSIRHLFSFWLANKLPQAFSRAGQGCLKFIGLWERNLCINLGDILTVIGRKL